MRIVFLDTLGLDDLDLSLLQTHATSWDAYQQTDTHQVTERIAGADVIITNKVVITQEDMQTNSRLRLICVIATGLNNVDLQAASRLGIAVCNCQAYGTDSVAQHVMMLMLALHTRLLDYHRSVQAGDWNRSSQFCLLNYPIFELKNRTLGILGYGVLGAEVERLARAFGMRVLIAERPGEAVARPGRVALDEMLPQIDVLTLHCPLTDETRNIINAERIARMRPGSFIVNAARGGIVNEQDLADALNRGHLGGAATDVLSQEPPRMGNVLLDSSIPNLIVTPHSAWGSHQARTHLVEQTSENIAAFIKGVPVRQVN